MLRRYWIIFTALLVAALLIAIVSCSKTEGQMLDPNGLGYMSCEKNKDCEPYGFCNEQGFCAAECRETSDCYLYELDRGVPEESLECRNYRCVDVNAPDDSDGDDEDGDVTDGDACGEETDIECRYIAPEDCSYYHWLDYCADRDCLHNGWRYTCSEDGKCVDNCEVDYGEVDDATTDDWYGTWAGIFTTAARTQGIPLVPYQDTSSAHIVLIRVSKQSGMVVFDESMCYMEMRNFDETRLYGVGEDLGQLTIPPRYYANVAELQHVIEEPPTFEPGATFSTTEFTEIRGAIMADTNHDNLPDRAVYESKCGDWDPTSGDPWVRPSGEECPIYDQDQDNKPGLTNIGIGALENTETYHNQIWTARYEGEVIDVDHMKGLLPNSNVQYQLSASKPSYVYDIEVQPHADADRSYFRFIRVSEHADCEDVMDEYNKEGSWLNFTAHLDDVTVD